MKRTHKIVTLLLLVVMLSATVLTACGGGGGQAATTTTPAGSTTPGATTTTTSGTTVDTRFTGTSVDYAVDDPLPGISYGSEGSPVQFFIFTWQSEKWNTETVTTGDVIDTTLFEHLAFIQDRLNLDIVFASATDNWNNRGNFVSKVEAQISSGNIPDLICSYGPTAVLLQLKGFTQNLMTITTLNNFSGTWWSKDMIDNAKIGDTLKYITGEASTSLLDQIQCIMMNLDKIEETNAMANLQGSTYADPYEMVSAGAWTWDNFITMTKDIYQDTSKDGAVGEGDTYGFSINNFVDYDSFPLSIGMKAMTASKSLDSPYSIFVQYKSKTMTDFVATIVDFIHTGGNLGIEKTYAGSSSANPPAFANGNICFSTGSMQLIRKEIRNKDFTYGVLPYPMLNSDQEGGYNSALSMYCSMFSIPATAANKEMSGAVLELLGWNGFSKVSKVIFEECFKTKYDLTGNDWAIYDILRSNLIYDPARLLGIGGAFSCFRDVLQQELEWSSTLQSKEKAANTEFTNLMKTT